MSERFDGLPNELIQNILRQCNTKELLSLRSVSKRFNDNIDSIMKDKIIYNDVKNSDTLDVVEQLSLKYKIFTTICYDLCNSHLYKLSNVYMLDLSYTDISDVSMLGGVYALDLSWCSNVIDVSALGKVHTVNKKILPPQEYCPAKNTFPTARV